MISRFKSCILLIWSRNLVSKTELKVEAFEAASVGLHPYYV